MSNDEPTESKPSAPPPVELAQEFVQRIPHDELVRRAQAATEAICRGQ